MHDFFIVVREHVRPVRFRQKRKSVLESLEFGRRARFDQIGKLINAGLLLAHRNAARRHTVEKER